MVLATNTKDTHKKQTDRMKNAKTKCAHVPMENGIIALPHSRSHVSFMMQVSDGESRLQTTTQEWFFLYFCWLLRGQCRCALAVSVFTKISVFSWLLRILFDNNRQQTLATFSLSFFFITPLFMSLSMDICWIIKFQWLSNPHWNLNMCFENQRKNNKVWPDWGRLKHAI